MGPLDYILLAIVAVCAVIAWRVWRRTMKKMNLLRRGAAGVDEPSKASRIREALLFCVQQENAQKNMVSVGS